MRERVVFQGRTYSREPDSKYQSTRVYYRNWTGKRLHHAIWESVHGKIPWGYFIHHKDGNPDNNSIENLEAVLERDHLRYYHGGAFHHHSKNEVV